MQSFLTAVLALSTVSCPALAQPGLVAAAFTSGGGTTDDGSPISLGQPVAGRASSGPITFECGHALITPARCSADYNADGGVDSDDVIVFFSAWDVGEVRADYTADGGVDSDDIIAFFSDWDTGCGG